MQRKVNLASSLTSYVASPLEEAVMLIRGLKFVYIKILCITQLVLETVIYYQFRSQKLAVVVISAANQCSTFKTRILNFPFFFNTKRNLSLILKHLQILKRILKMKVG